MPKLFKVIFTTRKKDLSYTDILELFVRWATESRKHGILALEPQLEEVEGEFILRGMHFVIDGITAEDLKDITEAEIEAIGYGEYRPVAKSKERYGCQQSEKQTCRGIDFIFNSNGSCNAAVRRSRE